MEEKKRTLLEVCELASRENNSERLSDLVEEILELLAEVQQSRNSIPPTDS